MEVNQRKLFADDIAKCDCTPREGILTETQGQMFYTELLNLKKLGFAIPEEVIIDALPVQFPKKIKEAILNAQKQQQQAMAQQQQEKQLIDQMRGAKIAADLGRAAERDANVEEHHADAALARVKTAKEIQQFGFDNLMGLLDRVIAVETAGRKESKTRR